MPPATIALESNIAGTGGGGRVHPVARVLETGTATYQHRNGQ
jgi:hypothetical protein